MNGKALLGLLGLGFLIAYWYALFWFATTYVINAQLTVGGVFVGLLAAIGFVAGIYITAIVFIGLLVLLLDD